MVQNEQEKQSRKMHKKQVERLSSTHLLRQNPIKTQPPGNQNMHTKDLQDQANEQ